MKAVVIAGAGGNFSSGGDVFEIIGPLVEMGTKGLTAFTRMTGELVKAMRAAPQPIVAAVDGICAGAGAIVAMASDIRIGTPRAKVAFLFNKVGLAGCDMGACAILPRIIGQGRASRAALHRPLHDGRGGRALGLLQPARARRTPCSPRRSALAREIAAGPTFAQHHDEAHARHGVGDVGRGGDRGRGRGAGAVHDDRGLRPRLPRLRREGEAGVRGRLRMPDRVLPRLAVLRGAPPRASPRELRAWAAEAIEPLIDHADVDGTCRRLVACLGEGGWLRAVVPEAYGGLSAGFDVRTLCLARETLAYVGGLADFAFAMQGLGSGADRAVRLARR